MFSSAANTPEIARLLTNVQGEFLRPRARRFARAHAASLGDREHGMQGWRWPTCSGASRGPIGAGGITRHTVRSFRPVARPRTEGEGEALTEDQEAFQEWAISHGVLHSVSRSVDEALAVLDAWGTLRVKIAVAGLMRAGDL
jgi:hypothetical protein